MGGMADLEIEQMERGSSWVYDNQLDSWTEVDNVVLMYTDRYRDGDRFEVYSEEEMQEIRK